MTPLGPRLEDRVWGCLLGGAVGDALGSPMEGLHYQVIRRIYPGVERFEQFLPEQIAEASKTRGWRIEPIGQVTDDTVEADLLLDCILEHEGQVTAYAFAKQWEKFAEPVTDPDGGQYVRFDHVHWLEQIPFYRNRSRQINKRELGRGEAPSDNAIMCIAPVGLLCAGDPLKAELMAVDVTSVNQHGASRDVAGGYAAGLAACLGGAMSIDELIELTIAHVRDYRNTRVIRAMVELAGECSSCGQYIEKYYERILGHLIPMQDLEHEGTSACISWDSAEVLGPALAFLKITQGQDAKEMILSGARLGRDADTVARCAGGLIGALRGGEAIPAAWGDYVLARNRWLRLREKADGLAALIRRRLRLEIAARERLL
ncbi:MAG: ADP-ribosylglycohydrolase family protein [Phycisphaeraceae bacterium]|nr:ADP-ribosylglycohydrolase family protein [Phycisphaeraceae bacterium]